MISAPKLRLTSVVAASGCVSRCHWKQHSFPSVALVGGSRVGLACMAASSEAPPSSQNGADSGNSCENLWKEDYLEDRLARLKEEDVCVYEKLSKAIGTSQRAYEVYGPDKLAFSFNGGKDSTILLHVLRIGYLRYCRGKSITPENSLGIKIFFFERGDDFGDVKEFVHDTSLRFGVDIELLGGNFIEGLQSYIDRHGVNGIFLGTRKDDPNATGQETYCPSTAGWPPFMRINPILDWTYHEVWSSIRTFQFPYCHLYDQGYTSLGGVKTTVRNSALRKSDGSYAPAWLLADQRLERAGRGSTAELRSEDKVSPQHSVALLVIGDELLSGKVPDSNILFLCQNLRKLGWQVQKVVVVGDEVERIASEVQRLSCEHKLVFTTGGIGPTPDDVTLGGVAQAFNTTLAEHPELAARLKAHFQGNVTAAHLKMAEAPVNEAQLIEVRDDAGQPTAFPILKCRNVFVMAGIPDLLRRKWRHVAAYLQELDRPDPFRTVVLRMNSMDESVFAAPMEKIKEHFQGEVAVGSYPVSGEEDGARVLLSLESRKERLLKEAQELLEGEVAQHELIAIEHDTELLVKGDTGSSE